MSEVGEMAPDGDIPIPEDAIDSFTLPCCPHCGPGSILKTDVVFFGDCVPREDVDKCYEKVCIKVLRVFVYFFLSIRIPYPDGEIFESKARKLEFHDRNIRMDGAV